MPPHLGLIILLLTKNLVKTLSCPLRRKKIFGDRTLIVLVKVGGFSDLLTFP